MDSFLLLVCVVIGVGLMLLVGRAVRQSGAGPLIGEAFLILTWTPHYPSCKPDERAAE